MFQGNEVCGAASGWHVLGVRDGELEASLEARVAHPVAAFQLSHLARGTLIHTNYTIVPKMVSFGMVISWSRVVHSQFGRFGWGLMVGLPIV